MKMFSNVALVIVCHQRKPTFQNIFERSGRFGMIQLEMNEIFDQKLCLKAMKLNSS